MNPATRTAIDMAFTTYNKNIVTALVKRGLTAYLVGDAKAQGKLRKASHNQLNAVYGGTNYEAAKAYIARYRSDLLENGGSIIKGELVPWLSDTSDNQKQAILDAIEQGVADGKHPREIARDLREVFDGTGHDPEAVARTETARIVSAGERQRYGDSEVEKVQWLLGDEACEECVAIAQANEGVYNLDDCPEIPYHVNCRCDISPIVAGAE